MNARFSGAILDTLFTCVGVLDLDGTLVDANAAFLEAAGVRLDEVHGSRFWDCYAWNYSESVRRRIREACEGAAKGQPFRFEASVRVAEDARKQIDLQIAPLRDDAGRITHLVASAVDITARRQREEELASLAAERSRERGLLARIVQHAPVAVAVMEGEDLRYTVVNPAYEAILSSHVPLLGRTFPEMFPEIAAVGAEAALRRVLHTGEPWRNPQFETPLAGRTGSTFWEVVALPLPETANHPKAVLVLAWEVTARKQNERALLESEERFRTMADGLPLLVWVHGPDGQQEFVNRTFHEFFGLSPAEITGEQWERLLHPEDGEAYISEFLACVRERRPFNAEVRVRRADGAWRWIESWGRPRFAPDGTFLGYVGASADVTDRRLAQDALRQSEARYRELVQCASSAILRWRRDGTITFFNEYAQTLFGYSESEALGRQIGILLPERDTAGRDLSGLAVDIAAHPEKHTESVNENVCRDGRRLWMLWTNRAVQDAHGNLVEVLAVGSDITRLKAAEDALRQADRRKDEFLAMLAHELRNPLAAMTNALHLMKLQADVSPTMDWGLETAERQTAHLSHLVDELLDVARISSGRLQIRPVAAELGTVVHDAAQTWRPRLESRGLQLILTLPEQAVPTEVDVARLAQVMDNLLDNAAKYTDTGGQVRVTLERREDHALIRVADTGVGLPPDKIGCVFELFEQVASDAARSAGGLGLGLHLVRRLVEMHGGTVDAHSEGAGRGSEFVVCLPVKDSSRTLGSGGRRAQGPVAPRRVMIVEDQADVADSLRALLAAIGHEVEVARDAAQAITVARDFEPEVALVDIGLPDMSGYDLAGRLRTHHARLRLIALSGHGRAEDRARALQAGFDEHLTKPASLECLVEVLAR